MEADTIMVPAENNVIDASVEDNNIVVPQQANVIVVDGRS
jgi:hypothetical protein